MMEKNSDYQVFWSDYKNMLRVKFDLFEIIIKIEVNCYFFYEEAHGL